MELDQPKCVVQLKLVPQSGCHFPEWSLSVEIFDAKGDENEQF